MSPHSPLVGRDVFFLFSLMNLKTIKSYINFHSTWGFFISSPDKEPQLQSGPRDSDVVCAAPRTSPAWAGLVSQSLGAWWALNSTFWASVFTTCSLTEGELFLPSSRKITHRAFLLITAVLLPGSQNHYRSCSICHSWYTFPRQSEPQLALCCTDHHMFQYTAVLFQLHPRGKKKVIDSFIRYLGSLYSCTGQLSVLQRGRFGHAFWWWLGFFLSISKWLTFIPPVKYKAFSIPAHFELEAHMVYKRYTDRYLVLYFACAVFCHDWVKLQGTKWNVNRSDML